MRWCPSMIVSGVESFIELRMMELNGGCIVQSRQRRFGINESRDGKNNALDAPVSPLSISKNPAPRIVTTMVAREDANLPQTQGQVNFPPFGYCGSSRHRDLAWYKSAGGGRYAFVV